jgi:hypothetical protein
LRDFVTTEDRCFPRDFAVSWVFVRMTGPSEMGIIGNEAWFSRRFPHPGVRISRKVQYSSVNESTLSSVAGATFAARQTAAVLISLTSTCQRLGVEPWAYLQGVLTCLPTTPADQADALLPDRWQAVRAAARTSEETAPGAGGSAPPADSLR